MVATEAASVLCQVVFHQDYPEFLPNIPTTNASYTAPPSGAGATPADQAPTKTTAPTRDIPTAIGAEKSISNCAQPTGGFGMEFELAAYRDSAVTLVAIFPRATTTRITPGQVTTYLQVQTTDRNLRHKSINVSRCKRTSGQSSKCRPCPGCSSRILKNSTLHCSSIGIPTGPKQCENGSTPPLLTQPSLLHLFPINAP